MYLLKLSKTQASPWALLYGENGKIAKSSDWYGKEHKYLHTEGPQLPSIPTAFRKSGVPARRWVTLMSVYWYLRKFASYSDL